MLFRSEQKLTSYVARHSWASIAKEMGYDVSVIGEGLGHADLATLKVYLDDLDQSVLDDANDAITL